MISQDPEKWNKFYEEGIYSAITIFIFTFLIGIITWCWFPFYLNIATGTAWYCGGKIIGLENHLFDKKLSDKKL